MSYLTQWTALNNEDFLGTVALAARKAAQDVANEEGQGQTWQARRNLALALLRDPVAHARPFLWAAATNPTVTAKLAAGEEVPDSDLDFIVASHFDTAVAEGGW